MKALSLWQPWASLIAIGAKRIETRHWATNYRGPLAIHAAKRPVDEETLIDVDLMSAFPTYPRHARTIAALRAWARETLPLGAILATANLYICGLIVGPGGPARRGQFDPLALSRRESISGNFEPGRYGWGLEKVEMLPAPIPARGAQGLWNWERPA